MRDVEMVCYNGGPGEVNMPRPVVKLRYRTRTRVEAGIDEEGAPYAGWLVLESHSNFGWMNRGSANRDAEVARRAFVREVRGYCQMMRDSIQVRSVMLNGVETIADQDIAEVLGASA